MTKSKVIKYQPLRNSLQSPRFRQRCQVRYMWHGQSSWSVVCRRYIVDCDQLFADVCSIGHTLQRCRRNSVVSFSHMCCGLFDRSLVGSDFSAIFFGCWLGNRHSLGWVAVKAFVRKFTVLVLMSRLIGWSPFLHRIVPDPCQTVETKLPNSSHRLNWLTNLSDWLNVRNDGDCIKRADSTNQRIIANACGDRSRLTKHRPLAVEIMYGIKLLFMQTIHHA
jgi:hypothetical protein